MAIPVKRKYTTITYTSSMSTCGTNNKVCSEFEKQNFNNMQNNDLKNDANNVLAVLPAVHTRPKLLDLYCCGGGAGYGYEQAVLSAFNFFNQINIKTI